MEFDGAAGGGTGFLGFFLGEEMAIAWACLGVMYREMMRICS